MLLIPYFLEVGNACAKMYPEVLETWSPFEEQCGKHY